MSMIQSVRGSRDFYPEEMALRQWLYRHIRFVSESYGYQEYDGPFLERLELYAAKSGEELVRDQSYVFPDRSGEMLALRPELTPSLARMVAQLGRGVPLPLRWWSFGPFWRYERTQRGRSREFFQWNIDLIGVDGPQADVELVAIACNLFQRVKLGADLIRIKVNNRRFAEARLRKAGISADAQPTAYHLIDRIDKLTDEEWASYASSKGFAQDQIDALKVVLAQRDAWEDFPELVEFFSLAKSYGIYDYLEYDPSVIRGLDYYTGTVYEAWDSSGNFRSILGGGRYDDLVSAVGGVPVTATGFAMGDVVFGLVLEAMGNLPTLRPNPAQIFIPTFEDLDREHAVQLAAELRQSGLRVEWYPLAGKLAKQFKYSDRQGIPISVIMGPDELANETVTVKMMGSGEQEVVRRADLVDRLMSLVEALGE